MAEKSYDAIVVGSGANGGWAAKELCEAGMQVAVLELGRELDPADRFQRAHAAARAAAARPSGSARPPGSSAARSAAGTTPARRPRSPSSPTRSITPSPSPKKRPFWWIRGNQVGGRTIMWGRQSYRMSDYDFKAKSHDGYGDDWPISYADVAPYYDKVESFIGVSGSREGVEVLPDGHFLPPMALSCGEHMLKDNGRRHGPPPHHRSRRGAHPAPQRSRRLPLLRPLPSRLPHLFVLLEPDRRRLPAAAATGKLTLITHALVHRVTLDSEARADGVLYFDTKTGEEQRVRAPIVILAASTLASARLLLTSAEDRFPNGLANSSGLVGRYLMDHIFAVGADGYLPLRKGAKAELAKRPNGDLHPALPQRERQASRASSAATATRAARTSPCSSRPTPCPASAPSGRSGSRARRWRASASPGSARCWRAARTAAISIPTRRTSGACRCCASTSQHGDNEAAMARDMIEQAVAMLEAAGAEEITTRTELPPPGFAIHEVGTARMGNDPKTSVLTPFLQTHDVKNLFVMDGSSYVSIGCVNPTLTMMALTVRACENLVAEAKRGNLA